MTLVHPLEPVFDENATVLILGSFPSPKSREVGFYYGHPRNRFWPTLAAVFDVPVPETIEEKRRLCLENRLALWDVVAECTIQGAADQTLKEVRINDFTDLIARTKIRRVFTTGSKAQQLYRKFAEPLTRIPAIQLPSTSPANCRIKDAELIEAYRVLKHVSLSCH